MPGLFVSSAAHTVATGTRHSNKGGLVLKFDGGVLEEGWGWRGNEAMSHNPARGKRTLNLFVTVYSTDGCLCCEGQLTTGMFLLNKSFFYSEPAGGSTAVLLGSFKDTVR